MKIFNWMNRRLRQNDYSPTISAHKDKYLSKNETRDTFETLSLLKHGGDVTAMGTFDSWKLAGFLTIGTIGIDPMEGIRTPTEKVEDEGLVMEKDLCEQYYDADHDVENTSSQVILEGNEIEMLPLMNEGCHEGRRPWNIAPKCNEMDIVVDREILGSVEKGKKKAERVTLADLFMADPHHHHIDTQSDSEADEGVACAKKPATSDHRAKKGSFSKAKKKLLNPHGLYEYLKHVKRMTKKKIHPDIHDKFQKNEEVPMNVAEIPTSNQADGGDERASLLPIHGVF